MDFILISESKIKIMLTAADMARLEIRAEDMDYSDTETKRAFWEILSAAKKKTGFDTEGKRMLVQLYPSKDGGCEMFVTLIEQASGTRNTYEAKKPSGKESGQSVSESATRKKTFNLAFSFDELQSCICACRELEHMSFEGESSFYVSDEKIYYLFLHAENYCEYLLLNSISFVEEFGRRENTERSLAFLCEHGTPLCASGAVAALGAL